MSNVQNDATEPRAFDDLSDAADAILDRWSDGEDLSEEEELEATDDVQEEETDEDITELDEDTEDDNCNYDCLIELLLKVMGHASCVSAIKLLQIFTVL